MGYSQNFFKIFSNGGSSRRLRFNEIPFLDKKWEVFFIALPFLILIVILCEIFFYDFVKVPTYMMAAISDIIFLGSAHIPITFLQLVSVPEFKQWAFERKKKHGYSIMSEMIIVFGGSFLFALALLSEVKVFPYQDIVLRMVWIYFPLQHALNQQLGISLCYNATIRKNCLLSVPDLNKMMLCERKEKIAFSLLIIFLGLFVLSGTTFISVKDETLKVLRVTLCASQLFIIIFILKTSYDTPASKKTTKLLFLARLLTLPWGVFSTISLWAGALIHGAEYCFIAQKVQSNSLRRKWGVTFFVALYSSAVGMIILNLTHPSIIKSIMPDAQYSPLLRILSSSAFALTWTHFYLDRQLYRMRDPISKKWVAPLVFNSI